MDMPTESEIYNAYLCNFAFTASGGIVGTTVSEKEEPSLELLNVAAAMGVRDGLRCRSEGGRTSMLSRRDVCKEVQSFIS